MCMQSDQNVLTHTYLPVPLWRWPSIWTTGQMPNSSPLQNLHTLLSTFWSESLSTTGEQDSTQTELCTKLKRHSKRSKVTFSIPTLCTIHSSIVYICRCVERKRKSKIKTKAWKQCIHIHWAKTPTQKPVFLTTSGSCFTSNLALAATHKAETDYFPVFSLSLYATGVS